MKRESDRVPLPSFVNDQHSSQSAIVDDVEDEWVTTVEKHQVALMLMPRMSRCFTPPMQAARSNAWPSAMAGRSSSLTPGRKSPPTA